MTKELEAFERIKNHTLSYTGDTYKTLTDSREMQAEDLNIIENALKRLENYEKNEDFSKDVINYAFLSEKDKIKKLKALEIIKKRECLFKGLSEVTQEEYELLKEILL